VLDWEIDELLPLPLSYTSSSAGPFLPTPCPCILLFDTDVAGVVCLEGACNYWLAPGSSRRFVEDYEDPVSWAA